MAPKLVKGRMPVPVMRSIIALCATVSRTVMPSGASIGRRYPSGSMGGRAMPAAWYFKFSTNV
jgi:hypothetical protein